MSQSSKAAISFAKTLGSHEITAVGFSPILREALARGATSCYSVPSVRRSSGAGFVLSQGAVFAFHHSGEL